MPVLVCRKQTSVHLWVPGLLPFRSTCMSAQEHPVYRFADFELDPRERKLLKGGASITLTPKVFETLVFLVQRAGRVVSKDELIKHLWPRGYIDDATLSNHVWQIRRVLGDSAKNAQFVETVPKLGYRFVSCVTAGSGLVEDPATAETPPAHSGAPELSIDRPGAPALARRTERRALWLGFFGLTAMLGVLATGLHYRSTRHAAVQSPISVSAEDRVVAFLGWNNLSNNAKDAWIAPALTSMLSTELSASDEIHVVPDELVREASTNLGVPLAAGLGRETLAKLYSRLRADYVVSGTYLVVGNGDDPPLRVDLTLQNARDGSVVATDTRQASLSGLNLIVNEAGGKLRAKLGVASPSRELLGLLEKAQPPSTDVARRIGLALDAMARYDAARARDELLEAVAEAPGYAPTYLHLAHAWSALGYRQKALAAAEQAVSRSDTLPDDMRLQIDATVQTLGYDWAHAAEKWKTLVARKPLIVEYRIELIDAELSAGAIDAAQMAYDDLRHLPQVTDDPRIDLAAARIAAAREDSESQASHAEAALRNARLREAPGLIADAEFDLAAARLRLGQGDQAKAGFTAAIDGYKAIGNPHGEIDARRALAGALNGGQPAREEYQRAMALAQSIGDEGGVAAVYRDLCSLLWNAGDRDGAQAAARQSLRLARETGDLRLQAWTLRALATIASDEAATDDVLNEYREVTALTKRSNDFGGHVWSLATNADLLRMRGDLDGAQRECVEAQKEASALSDPQFAIYSGFICAQLAIDRGDNPSGRRMLDAVVSSASASGNKIYLGNSYLLLGQLEYDAMHWHEAIDDSRRAVQQFTSIDAQTGVADAEALLALSAQALGAQAERDAAVTRIKKLHRAITSRSEIFFVDIALAQLSGATAPNESVARLRELASDAEHRHWLAWSLEAKVAEWRVLKSQENAAASANLGRELSTTARKLGFGRIVAQLQEPTVAGIP